MLSQKEQDIKELSAQIDKLTAELSEMAKSRQTMEQDKEAHRKQLLKEQ